MANGTGKLIQFRYTIHPFFYYFNEYKVEAGYYDKTFSSDTEFVAAQYTITVLKDIIDKNIILVDVEKQISTIKNLDIDVVYQYIAEKRFMRRTYDVRCNHLFQKETKKVSPHILLTQFYFPKYINWIKTNAALLFSLPAYSDKEHQEEYRVLLKKWDGLLENFNNGDKSLIDDIESNPTLDKVREIYLPTEDLTNENNNLQKQLERANQELHSLKNTLDQYETLQEIKKRIKEEAKQEVQQQIADLQTQLLISQKDNKSLTYSKESIESKLEITNKELLNLRQQQKRQLEELNKQHNEERFSLKQYIKKLEEARNDDIAKFQQQITDLEEQLSKAKIDIEFVTYYKESLENTKKEYNGFKQQQELQLEELNKQHIQEIDSLKQEKEMIKGEKNKVVKVNKHLQEEHNELINKYNKLVAKYRTLNAEKLKYEKILSDQQQLKEFYYERYGTTIGDEDKYNDNIDFNLERSVSNKDVQGF